MTIYDYMVQKMETGKRIQYNKTAIEHKIEQRTSILSCLQIDRNVHTNLTCATFYQRFIISPILYNMNLCRYLRLCRTSRAPHETSPRTGRATETHDIALNFDPIL